MFFFSSRRRHTRCSRDWSSDVCSSDLLAAPRPGTAEKMNIAIFGWYHHRNAGDDRIQQCLTRWLEGHTLAFLPAGRRPPVHLLRTCDAAILGGGGLIRDRGGMFRDMARWVRAAGIPVALAGVSVEGITPELRAELRAF